MRRHFGGARGWRLGPVLLVLSAAGCGKVLPPLGGDIDVGHDAYGIFVGGSDRASDLYAYDPNRAEVRQLTYTAVAELAPALSPDGKRVALLRAGTLRDSLPGTAWVLDLETGTDRELELPRGAGPPARIGWAPGGTAVFVAADSGVYRFDAPLGSTKPRRVSAQARVAADSSFAVLLGDPVFAQVVRCDGGRSLCTVGDTGGPQLLAHGARDPVRWGRDSVGYFVDDALRVRPVGSGRLRPIRWEHAPPHPRAMTYFSGAPAGPSPPGERR